jgi:integrase
VLKPLCRRLGIEPAGLNALRHGQATLLDQVNAPMKIRQKRMGHTDARITLGVYTHTAPIDERRVADEIDALLSPNVAPILRSESTAAYQVVVN